MITTNTQIHNTLRLFNALPIQKNFQKNPSKKIIELTYKYGFIFSPHVCANYTENELKELITDIADEIGLENEQVNKSFHKSWKKVRDAPIEQLIAEQIYHYMTTYGFKSMGVYDKDTVYIPFENIDIPETDKGIKLTIINGYTTIQLKKKLLKLLNSGIALKSIDETVSVAKYVKLTEQEVLKINNKEVRIRMYGELDLIPEEPTDMLRLALYESIGKTLLINNKKTTEMISSSEKDVSDLFLQYDENFEFKRLAEIFNRFKPIFLAFKSNNEATARHINLIGHLSKKYHKPMKQSVLNNITEILNSQDELRFEQAVEFKNELKRVNIFRKIRLAQSLKYRMSENRDIVYKIRNGKSFATTFDFKNIEGAEKVYDALLISISNDLQHLKGKKFYIPSNITYALPSTEKQFTGGIPSGSYVSVPKDMIFGIWWKNTENSVDLDLSVLSPTHGKVGWDSRYRTDNNSLLFSGDVTDAPDGATEMFHIDNEYDDVLLVSLNNYTYYSEQNIPFKIIIADEATNQMSENYMVNPNNVKCTVKSKIDTTQKIIGLVAIKNGECRFYFNEYALDDTISMRENKYTKIAQNYMVEYGTTQITLNEILEKVGAKIIDQPTKNAINLSIENLQKDTFINLLLKPKQ